MIGKCVYQLGMQLHEYTGYQRQPPNYATLPEFLDKSSEIVNRRTLNHSTQTLCQIMPEMTMEANLLFFYFQYGINNIIFDKTEQLTGTRTNKRIQITFWKNYNNIKHAVDQTLV